MSFPKVFLTTMVLLILVSGCGRVHQAAQRQQRINNIKMIGLSYHAYFDSNRKGPSGPADLHKFLQDAEANKVLTDGSFVLQYDVKISDVKPSLSEAVLGYDADTGTKGGIALMADGSVRTVTAEEFQKLPKASPKAK